MKPRGAACTLQLSTAPYSSLQHPKAPCNSPQHPQLPEAPQNSPQHPTAPHSTPKLPKTPHTTFRCWCQAGLTAPWVQRQCHSHPPRTAPCQNTLGKRPPERAGGQKAGLLPLGTCRDLLASAPCVSSWVGAAFPDAAPPNPESARSQLAPTQPQLQPLCVGSLSSIFLEPHSPHTPTAPLARLRALLGLDAPLATPQPRPKPVPSAAQRCDPPAPVDPAPFGTF